MKKTKYKFETSLDPISGNPPLTGYDVVQYTDDANPKHGIELGINVTSQPDGGNILGTFDNSDHSFNFNVASGLTDNPGPGPDHDAKWHLEFTFGASIEGSGSSKDLSDYREYIWIDVDSGPGRDWLKFINTKDQPGMFHLTNKDYDMDASFASSGNDNFLKGTFNIYEWQSFIDQVENGDPWYDGHSGDFDIRTSMSYKGDELAHTLTHIHVEDLI